MSFQRLTLLPQQGESEARVARPSKPAQVPAQTPQPPVEVISIVRLTQSGRWQTEAMRSYSRPVLLWFTRGQGKITISGRTSGYGTHNAIFLPAGIMHGFSVMGQVLGSVVHLPRDPAMVWPRHPRHLRLRDAQTQRELTGHVDALEREAMVQDARTGEALMHHAGLLSVWLDRAIQRFGAEDSPPQETQAHRLTAAYTSLIERDFHQPVGVRHFADLLGVTPTHLSRVCRQVSGRAALDILKDRRHFEARRLLRGSSLKIADIAERTGFASPAYFTRAFLAHTGQNPSDFRNAG